MTDITLAEVTPLTQHARFFKDGARDMVEISYVGSKDNIIKKVAPEHMARFRPEWDAFCDGRPLSRRPGTPLTDCPTIDQNKADSYVARNVHNLEELAALNDMQCQQVGHGTLTDRKGAIAILAARKIEAFGAQREAVSKAAATVIAGTPTPAASADIAEIKSSISELTQGMAALVALLTQQAAEKKKPGRPSNAEKAMRNMPAEES